MLMAAGLLTAWTMAAKTVEVGGITYEIADADMSAEVVESDGEPYSGEIVVPSMISVGGQSYNVYWISEKAFAGCKDVTAVVLSEGLEGIYSQAFAGTSIESITLPASVEELGAMLFIGCDRLKQIDVAPGNLVYYSDNGVVMAKETHCLCYYPPAREGAYTVPADITQIGYTAFTNCNGLTEVKLPKGVINIAFLAFAGCHNLRKINLPEGLLVIGDQAFTDCYELGSLTIPRSVEKIGSQAFKGCQSIKELKLPRPEEYYGAQAFSLFPGEIVEQ